MSQTNVIKAVNTKPTKKIIHVLSAGFILAGLYWIHHNTNWRELQNLGGRINYTGVAVVLLFTIVNILLQFYRWYLLLKPIKPHISWRNVFSIGINGLAVNFAIVGKMGVPAKALLLKNLEGIEIARSAPSLFSELLLEYGALVVMMIVAAITGGYLEALSAAFGQGMAINIAIAAGVTVAAGLCFLLLRRSARFVRFLAGFRAAWQITGKRRDIISATVALSFANMLLSFGADWLLLRSLGLDVPLLFVILAGALANVAGLLSPLSGGLGVREVSIGYLFETFLGAGEIAIAATLIRRLLTYLGLLLLFLAERFTSGKSPTGEPLALSVQPALKTRSQHESGAC